MVRFPFFKETNNITDALLFVFLSVFAPQLRLLLHQQQSETGSCVAVSDLLNCIIDHLMDRVCAWIPGVRLGSYLLKSSAICR